MVDNLQQHLVPQRDGGVLVPIVSYASLMLTNYSQVILGEAGNTTSVPEFGNFVLNWFLSRVSAQAPQFGSAGSWFLITVIALILIFVLLLEQKLPPMLRRLLRLCRCRRFRHSRRRAAGSAYASSSPLPTMASFFGPMTSLLSRTFDGRDPAATRLVVLTVLLVVSTATLGVHWYYDSYGFGALFRGAAGDSGAGSGSLSQTVNLTLVKLNSFIKDTLVRTNSTVLDIFYDAFPNILNLFERIAKGYLDLLSSDFRLTPVLNTFDNFLGLVKLLLASMNWIKDSRDSVLTPLNSFTTVVNRTREDIRSKVADACTAAPANGVPVELCNSIYQQLNQLTIGLNTQRIDSDSSVTIVTLLDRIFKLNVTEVEGQVNSAKSILTNSLTLIADEITKLFNSLTGEVSGLFAGFLDSAETLRSSMLSTTRSKGFVEFFKKGDEVLLSMTVLIAIFYALPVVFLLAEIYSQARFCYYSRQFTKAQRQMGGDSPQSPNDLQQTFPEIMRNQEEQQPATSSSRQRQSRAKERMKSCKIPKRWPIILVFVFGLAFAIFFLLGFAQLYAGSMVQLDACRYLTAQSGTAVVDRMLDTVIDTDLWPVVQRALETKVSIPLPITRDMLPRGLLEVLLRRCADPNVTFFQIYNLTKAFNVTGLLYAKEVQTQLYKGKDMVNEMIGGLNASTLIPAEVDAILTVLPEFAKIIDTQDYSASIAELGKPLLNIGAGVPALIGNLLAVVRILLDRNPSDNRAILIRHFAGNLNTTYLADYPPLVTGLSQLRQHFVTLQTNRIIQNLTAELTFNLAQLKLVLLNKTALLSAVAVRYDQVLAAYLPEIAQLANRLVTQTLGRVGHCDGVTAALGVVVGECTTSLANLSYGGFYLMLSSALVVLLCLVSMALLRIFNTRDDFVDDRRPSGAEATQPSSRETETKSTEV